MAAMDHLKVKDDAASPLETTLAPVTDTPIPLWRGQSSGVPFDGQARFSASTEKVKNSSAYKTTVKLEVPVMETLGASGTSAGYVAPPKVAYTNTFIGTMFSDGRSTKEDRANLLKMAIGLIQGATSTTSTGTLDQASAGDAWKSSGAPIPQLFIMGVQPN